MAKLSPFDVINSITFEKKHLIRSGEIQEKEYVPFMTNRGLSYFADTVFYVNELNRRPWIEKRLQYDFLFHIVPKKKRFSKWTKTEKASEEVELIMAVYGYSEREATKVSGLLNSEQLAILKTKTRTGGNNGTG